ncbi:hypothetical protein JEZ13_05015 [bacterium]|nr:hypothetical protein [bacterium]
MTKSSYYLILVALSMMLLIMVGCSQDEDNDAQVLLSDKQSELSEMSEEGKFNLDESEEDVSLAKHSDEAEAHTGNSEVSQSQEDGLDRLADNNKGYSQSEDDKGQESSTSSTYKQKIVYTKLNTWNNNADFYEIAFNSPIDSLIMAKNYNKYIKFIPETKGRFVKNEEKILRFYPEGRFLGNSDYKVKIDQARLFGEGNPKVELSFYNSSPVLKIGLVSLHPTQNQDEYYLDFIVNHYRGRYSDDDYRSGIKILLGGKNVEIDKISYENDGVMTITSKVFTADPKDTFTISPKGNIFRNDSVRELYYANSINEMRKFILMQTETITDKQGNARIELSFSKNLDTKQSLSGMLLVIDEEEEVTIKISKFMNKVVITGDFALNKQYKLHVKSGIKAADTSVMSEDKVETIHTYNRERMLEFVDNGIFLSSINNNSINIKVVNYFEYEYQLWAIQVENIAEMIHNLNIVDYSNTSQFSYYRNENLHWYGEQIKSGSVKTEVKLDEESFIKLDLGKVAKADPNKIYILNLTGRAKADDGLKISGNQRHYYYNNKVSKMALFTDIAVSAKAFKSKMLVNVVDVTTGKPIKRADVELRAYNNLLLASGKTNWKGELLLDNLTKPLNQEQFFIIAKYKDELGFLSSNSMYLDNTKFKVQRDYAQGDYKLEAFLDRNLYRPGESVNLMIMVRDSENKLIKADLPLKATVYNPMNVKVVTEKITDLEEGMATYNFATQDNSDTGRWLIEVDYGNQKKLVNFTLETFVPERINTTLKADKERYLDNDDFLDLTLTSNYLFGAPLVNANCSVSINFQHDYSFGQEKFSEYSFVDEFSSLDYKLYSQAKELRSNENGVVNTSFKLLSQKESSHPYFIRVNASITEEGGRPIERNLMLPASPQKEYIGLSNNPYIRPQGDTFKLPLVVVDDSGKNLSDGRQVEYIVYGKRGSWWWDYDYNFQASYKKSESTSVISKGKVTIGKDNFITFTPQTTDFHVFIVEAKIVGNDGYEVNKRYFNSYWGDDSELTEDSSLELKTDKAEYDNGETVKISIPSSKGSKIFLNVIKQNEVLKEEIIDVKDNGDYVYEFEAHANMTPNVYVDVRVIQGQKEKNNDLPLRLYGIIPVKIVDKNTKLELKIDVPTKISSNSKLSGSIDVGVKQKTKYIVSIVDQGLVNRTNYTIPNPWDLFYRNEGYFAQDYDNFSYFLNAQNQDIFRTIMIGGGMDMEASFDQVSLKGASGLSEMNRLQETGVQRFKPVAYFLGIKETDNNGKGSFQVEIGDYIGALKVTVIAVNEEAFGRAIQHTFVKDDIIAMPTIPRVLTPNDEIQIPVSVVIEANISSDVEIELVTNELVTLTSSSKQVIKHGENRGQLIFSAKVKEEIGKAEFTFKIKSKEFQGQKKIEVGVRLPSAYQTESEILSFTDNAINYPIPEIGLANSSQVYLSFTQGFEFDADQYLRGLIRYPYGGAVMKTATTFNQLLLIDFIKDANLRNEIDANVNTYFRDIVKYNRQGLYEWPNWWKESESRKLMNIYALHTCILAKERGYNINDFIYTQILNYLKKTPVNTRNIKFEDAYQLYVLALAGEADIAKLNYFNEQETIYVNNHAKTMLELAYQESGFAIKDIFTDMKAEVIIEVKDTSNSNLRPNEDIAGALELYYNSIYNNKDEKQRALNRATALAFARKMQASTYSNYYEKGWNLFALLGYVGTLPKDYQNYSEAELEVSIGNKREIIKVMDSYIIDLTPYKKKELNIKAISANAKDLTVTLQKTYVPKIGETKSSSNNINLYVTYTDLNASTLDVSTISHGQSFIAEIKTSTPIDNMDFATTYILPSGWEFSPEKIEINYYDRNNKLQAPSYVDVRDDRVIIYGKSVRNRDTIYKCKINTVTKGKFNMPSSTAEDIYHPENQAVIQSKVVVVE